MAEVGVPSDRHTARDLLDQRHRPGLPRGLILLQANGLPHKTLWVWPPQIPTQPPFRLPLIEPNRASRPPARVAAPSFAPCLLILILIPYAHTHVAAPHATATLPSPTLCGQWSVIGGQAPPGSTRSPLPAPRSAARRAATRATTKGVSHCRCNRTAVSVRIRVNR